MVHAQLTFKAYTLHDHTGTSDGTGVEAAYEERGRLDKRYLGDVYAAMCSFGICLTNPPHKTVIEACEEVGKIQDVKRKLVKNCSVQYDTLRRGTLYDPSGRTQVKANVAVETGIISSILTGAGAHFIDTLPGNPDQKARMDAAVQKANRAYCQPQSADPGGAVQPPFALDGQDRLYIVDQGSVEVPVLEYGGDTCIDYTSNSYVRGILVIDNAGGVARKCVTRDFHRVIDPSSVYNNRDDIDGVAYTRRIGSLGEGYGTDVGTRKTLNHLHAWLASPFNLQHDLIGGGAAIPGGGGAPMVALQPIGRDVATMDTGCCGGRDPHVDGDKSLLGGPLPVMIVPSTLPLDHGPDDAGDQPLANTVRVAPLVQRLGAKHSASFAHDGAVDVDLLASRVSRTGARNTIGIAMQRILPNTQGDLMLHDGV